MIDDINSEPIFRHFDDEQWREVRVQDHGGERKAVWEKWLEFAPHCMALHARWDPGMIVHKHGHQSHQAVYVLEGSMMCGDVLCTKGMHIRLDHGAALGPLIAGPDGVELYEVMMGDPRSWPADPEGFESLLEEKGVKKLPNPPLDFPDWIVDGRSE